MVDEFSDISGFGETRKFEQSLAFAKEAVTLDLKDGFSWCTFSLFSYTCNLLLFLLSQFLVSDDVDFCRETLVNLFQFISKCNTIYSE